MVAAGFAAAVDSVGSLVVARAVEALDNDDDADNLDDAARTAGLIVVDRAVLWMDSYDALDYCCIPVADDDDILARRIDQGQIHGMEIAPFLALRKKSLIIFLEHVII